MRVRNWNQGSLSRNIMPEEEIPTIDESLYPDNTDWEELIEKVIIHIEENETNVHNRIKNR